MKKRLSAKRYGSLALALAAFAVAGTAPVFAQSSGAWNAGISARSGTPYVHTQSTNVSGSGAYEPMSALIPKSDVDRRASDVRNVPKAAVSGRSKSTLFDHLVGSHKQGLRHSEPEGLSGLEIDDQIERGW
jgi:hypothetical protein